MTMREFKKYLEKAIREKEELIDSIQVNTMNYMEYHIQLAKRNELLNIKKVINL